MGRPMCDASAGRMAGMARRALSVCSPPLPSAPPRELLLGRRAIAIALVCLTSLAAPLAAQAPVNPHATPAARALLATLYANRGKRIIAGQHNYNHEPGRYTERATEIAGRAPIVWGTDFIWNGTEDPGPRIVREAIARHRAGAIVTLMWHAGRPQDDPPFDWTRSIQAEMTDAEWRELTTPGTALNARWTRQVDVVAGYLAELRDAGVPVLWRPYHEMNGVWFWWGDKRGPNGYAKLYRMLYDRFVNVHHLDNLLWVWDANGPRDIPKDEAFSYALYYPGPRYVDVLATDIYNFDYEQKDYEELKRLARGKPIALGEVGELPKPEILDAQPDWSWFMVWANWLETHNTPERVKAVYAMPRTQSSGSTAAAVDSTAVSWRTSLATTMRHTLTSETLGPWYPRAVDRERGGFLSQFDAAWNATGAQDKMIVTQARHVWTTARAARFYGTASRVDTTFLAQSAHGYRFLRDRMWDRERGGFYWLVTRDGTPKPEADGRLLKQAYGEAFGIYALSGYYEASGDTSALRLAQDAFRWLDAHAHDARQGGYFNYLERDGTPLRAGLGRDGPKDQNSSIHILEALTELYRVWPDPVLRSRVQEMLTLIRDRIVVAPGTLTQFSNADWTPISYRDSTDATRRADRYFHDHVSFGHDVETAYLMLEASDALGMEHDTLTLAVGKRMLDHALHHGFDESAGGFYEAGYFFKERPTTLVVVDSTKNWWAQAEGLNTLLIFADRFPDDPMQYRAKFLRQWSYVDRYLVDHEHGGWYQGGLDRQPEQRTNLKGFIWKAAYHDGRALMNVIGRLESPPPPLRSAQAR